MSVRQMHRRNEKPKPPPTSPRANVDFAIESCRLRGARMTPLRIAVLKTLWSAGRPLGAYEMRALVSRAVKREIAAPSVYRTLDFLCEFGVAARIESRKRLRRLPTPRARTTLAFFLVCDGCGDATEIENAAVERLINDDAKRLGFSVKHRVLELSGVCGPWPANANRALTAPKTLAISENRPIAVFKGRNPLLRILRMVHRVDKGIEQIRPRPLTVVLDRTGSF